VFGGEDDPSFGGSGGGSQNTNSDEPPRTPRLRQSVASNVGNVGNVGSAGVTFGKKSDKCCEYCKSSKCGTGKGLVLCHKCCSCCYCCSCNRSIFVTFTAYVVNSCQLTFKMQRCHEAIWLLRCGGNPSPSPQPCTGEGASQRAPCAKLAGPAFPPLTISAMAKGYFCAEFGKLVRC
jgi:hypothetical protein